MIPFLSLALAQQPPSAADAMSYQHVVFTGLPSDRKRRKVIRKAMRRDERITGGRDWGRVLCFVSAGPSDPAVLERALRGSNLEGLVRDADDCTQPPGEAYIPPDPEAYARVTLLDALEPMLVRQALAFVLEDDHGVTGLHLAPAASDRVCLELERAVDDAYLLTLLETGPLRVASVVPADDCGDALGIDP